MDWLNHLLHVRLPQQLADL